ncbi:MAG: MBL fold metallo-hydrolase [Kiritimatiellae bacterium]|nr:MBL fold metallo-hydrolase [Kiritimatiellia bacterium]
MKIHFLGGVDTVTGSSHIVDIGSHRVLRDCGLFQGRRAESFERNRNFQVPVDTLDAMVLSHAHIDHCGNIPTLARLGYRQSIHATTATVQLCDIMLRDAAHIQESDAAYLNQKTNRQGLPKVEPLYTMADAERALPLFRGHPYAAPFDPVPGLRTTFHEAGHILGAGLTEFEHEGRRALFAVDLGRPNLPLIRDPKQVTGVDLLVLESTYGARRHGDAADAEGQLLAVLDEASHRRGKVFIPSFALERAQEILFHLARLAANGRWTPIPVYVDSPMASAITRVFQKNTNYLDEEFHDLRERFGSVFDPGWVHFAGSVDESKRITRSQEPCVVIAASGMCEHGRILHHLKDGIENPANHIVFVGYQASYTLGRRIVSGEKRVRIFGDNFRVRAKVHRLDAFSAHADRDDLIAYARAARPKHVCLVHGEDEGRDALAEALRAEGLDVLLPKPGDVVEV